LYKSESPLPNEDHRIYEVQDFGVQKFSEATMGKNSFLKN
jgi:hypothetical protein